MAIASLENHTLIQQRPILNSLREIQKRNKLGKKSQYIKQNQWRSHFVDVYPDAIFKAADYAFGGIEINELKSLIDLSLLQQITLELLESTYVMDVDSLVQLICERFPLGLVESDHT